MTTVGQVRKGALALPEVTETTTMGTVAFRVRDKAFVRVTGEGLLQVQIDPADIDRTLEDLPAARPLLRRGTSIGVQVPLASINGMQSNALVRRAWTARAPKRLATATSVAERAEPGAVGDLPTSLGRPATRGLVAVGVTSLAKASGRTERELAGLHGVGPRALRILSEALREHGLGFRSAPDADQAIRASLKR